jgi:hypothetical protein
MAAVLLSRIGILPLTISGHTLKARLRPYLHNLVIWLSPQYAINISQHIFFKIITVVFALSVTSSFAATLYSLYIPKINYMPVP